MKNALIHSSIIVVTLAVLNPASAQNLPTASQIERTNQLLNAQDRLNKIIQSPRSFHIKDIILKVGGSCRKTSLKETIEPYKNRWLTETDIQELIELLKDSCNQKTDISYRIKDNTLEIEIVDFQANLH